MKTPGFRFLLVADKIGVYMIFVILGTQKFQMNRLIKYIDSLVAAGRIDTPVIAQIGQSDYEPVNYQFHRFLDKAEFDKLVTEAELIVTHGGVNSIITALRCGKPVIVCPRLEKYGEHVDDHQREIARSFAKKGFVLCCDDDDDLEEQISLCKVTEFREYVSTNSDITSIINDYLAGLERFSRRDYSHDSIR